MGALARVALSRALPHPPDGWPWATLIVNGAGTLLLAWLTTRLTEIVAPTRYWRLVLGTGFCGALTTFSTFQIEFLTLVRHGAWVRGVGYAATSLAVGGAFAVLATVAARRRRYG